MKTIIMIIFFVLVLFLSGCSLLPQTDEHKTINDNITVVNGNIATIISNQQKMNENLQVIVDNQKTQLENMKILQENIVSQCRR